MHSQADEVLCMETELSNALKFGRFEAQIYACDMNKVFYPNTLNFIMKYPKRGVRRNYL